MKRLSLLARGGLSSLGLVATLLLTSCSLFHADYPGECSADTDCWMASGEVCNLTSRRCEIPADAAPRVDAPPVPDAPPAIDSGAIDATPTTIDAGPADAAVSDAS